MLLSRLKKILDYGEEYARKKRRTETFKESFCLVRAVSKDSKISTQVSATQIGEFQGKLIAVMRQQFAVCLRNVSSL